MDTATVGSDTIARSYVPSPTVCMNDTVRALDYLLRYKRCGIFGCVRNGRLVSFIPFYNPDFKCIAPPRVEPNHVQRKRKAQPDSREVVIPDTSRWWFNGHVVCNVEGAWRTGGVAPLREMFEAVARAVSDCDFFVNRRDYPQVRVDGRLSEPAQGNPRVPKVFSDKVRMFSAFTGGQFKDIPMPCADDWALVQGRGRQLAARARSIPFAERQPRAVFRGSATGPGVDTRSNQRLMLASLSAAHRDVIDAGVTSFSRRDQVVDGTVAFMDHVALNHEVPKVKFMPLEEQMRFQLILYAQGHSAAARYGTLMHTGCLIVRLAETVDAPSMWFFKHLVGFDPLGPVDEEVLKRADHVVVRNASPENTLRVVKWALRNPLVAASIAARCLEKAERIFCTKVLLNYLVSCFGEKRPTPTAVHSVYSGTRTGGQHEALQMVRKVNNAVKVICFAAEAATRPRPRVLDLACGEGGDILKWDRVGASSYVGVDLVPQQIERFRERLKNIKLQSLRKVSLSSHDVRDLSLSPGWATVISMQFAVHYIASSRAATLTFLQNIYHGLEPGGCAIVSTMSGVELRRRLARGRWSNEICSIVSTTGRALAKGWGAGYRFALDTRVPDGGAVEFVVDEEAFADVAREAGFGKVMWFSFREVLGLEKLRGTLRGSAFKLPEYDTLLKTESDIVDLYVVYIFTKCR